MRSTSPSRRRSPVGSTRCTCVRATWSGTARWWRRSTARRSGRAPCRHRRRATPPRRSGTRRATARARKTSARLDRLQGEGVVATQRRDEAEASFRTARDGAEAARAQYEVALAGMRKEDRAAVTAELRRAEGAVRELSSYVDENTL